MRETDQEESVDKDVEVRCYDEPAWIGVVPEGELQKGGVRSGVGARKPWCSARCNTLA